MSSLQPAWILDAAAGTAPAAVRLLVSCQAELSRAGGAAYASAEAAFGALFEDQAPAVLRPDSFERLSARLDHENADDIGASAASLPEGARNWPRALTTALTRTGGAHWRRRIGGLHEAPLPAFSEVGIEARLIRLSPGRAVAEHGHEGAELTLVLEGGFNDGRADYVRGDVCEADGSLKHIPRAHTGGPCTCLVVEMGALRFSNPVVAVLDRLTRSVFNSAD